jgi:hypothetical protein
MAPNGLRNTLHLGSDIGIVMSVRKEARLSWEDWFWYLAVEGESHEREEQARGLDIGGDLVQ